MQASAPLLISAFAKRLISSIFTIKMFNIIRQDTIKGGFFQGRQESCGQMRGYFRIPVPICRESPGKSKLPGKILQNIRAILVAYTQFDKKLRPARRLIFFWRE